MTTADPDWDRLHRGWNSRGYLPHFDLPGLFQSITFRLHDSLPSSRLTEIHAAGAAGSEEYHDALDAVLDAGTGNCWLAQPRIALLVEDALLHSDGTRYSLLHWVVMSNHVHTLIRVEPGHPLGKVVSSWKAFTGREANRLLGRVGPFWEPDYYDRAMRSEKHYYATAEYIENNPVKAGLCKLPEEWRFGSAYARWRLLTRPG